MNKVRVRIAPSPTGFAHVGTAYTALFNFAFARKNKGDFILRIEDTDVKRNIPKAEEAIYEGLKWLGLDWDEGPDKGGKFGPYRQSERLALYQGKADELLKKGWAYRKEGAIKLKSIKEDITWKDEIRGKISFPMKEIKDFVIIKSDGYPTYNFAVVVDDISMRITHVIRGEEHISNTPRQILVYKAFGVDPPLFVHLPTLRNKDRKKLSKRRDPVDLRFFRDEGYLSSALINFLCLLGWSHPEGKEVFSLAEFIEKFDLSRIRTAGPIFDIGKLDWLNGFYIRNLSDEDFANFLIDFLKIENKKDYLLKIAPLVKDRIKKLSEFNKLASFFFSPPKVDKKLFLKGWKLHLAKAQEALEEVSEWNKFNLDKVLLELVERNSFIKGDFFMNLRIAITGARVTPPINDSIVILGKKETLRRLKQVL